MAVRPLVCIQGSAPILYRFLSFRMGMKFVVLQHYCERSRTLNVVFHVILMRERLEKMSELAQSHMMEAQEQQKSWYDKSTQHRSFNPGQKVLVVLPSENTKLLAR